MDALVSERLSWSSRIVGVYGSCGLSAINEAASKDLDAVAVPAGDGRPSEPLNDTLALDVRNDLTGTQKLEYALEMFEATALLHSYPGGVIIHDDIQLTQFLIIDGRLKLNDFNRAEIMLFNEKDQEYCRYRNDPGMGDVSPTRGRLKNVLKKSCVSSGAPLKSTLIIHLMKRLMFGASATTCTRC